MQALADCLRTYAERHFQELLVRDPTGVVRPVLVGPPDVALREAFDRLTGAGQHDWRLTVGAQVHEVVVLLVDDNSPPAGTGLSRGCHWDYAVSIRNSSRCVLILATRGSWDNRPESLANTTETIGQIGTVARTNDDPLEAHLVTAVSTRLSLAKNQTRELLRLVRKESFNLEPASRDAMAWAVLESLLSAPPSVPPVDSACRAAGLPIIGQSTMGFLDAYAVLSSLAEFIGAEGLREAVDQMKATTAAVQHGAVSSLDSLHRHLSAALFSPTLLKVAPAHYYKAPVSAWYDTLTASVLADILAELDQGQPQDRLTLTCINGLPAANPIRKGPFVVAASPEVRASSATGMQPVALDFTRKVDRTPSTPIVPSITDPMSASDPAPPAHRKPIKYKVDAPNTRPGTVDVIALQQFGCGGLVVARDAERNGVPTQARNGPWTQEMTLSRGGTIELLLFHASHVAQVSVAQNGDSAVRQPTVPGAVSLPLSVELEDNDTFDLALIDADGAVVGQWTLLVTVRDVADVADSRLEALIQEHRTKRKTVPHAPDTALHRLELGSYLNAADSWKPVIACWSTDGAGRRSIDWSGDCALGDVQPQIDPRPEVNPPSDVLAAREAVRALLAQEQRCISEVELNAASITPLIAEYLRCYRSWLESVPQAATWFDVLAIHAAEWNAQAGRHVATDEPVVMLLSSLHPLRLAWHSLAQQELADSLTHPCPVAGLLSPSHCPDSSVLFVRDGQAVKPRAFFSLPCQHPHWAVLVNVTFLDKPTGRAAAMNSLAALGLQVQAINGGFTAQQTQDSLREVNRLLPARATLRIGIVGDAEASSECGEGVFQWSEVQHARDASDPAGSFQVEVFDTRGASDPSPEQLADLSEITSERVRWFKLAPNATVPKLDLTIIDQLGARSHEAATGATRSALGRGGLFRARVREDFQDARAIVESRVGITRATGTDFRSLLGSAIQAFEQLSAVDAGRTHFRFTPNQDAVGSRLRNAIFLSLTSSQIDPACIVRGTVGQSGYLWDYELPGVLGGGESSLGYYLVAQPTTAMCDAVERAAALVASPPPSIPGLLEEVSRHGIPILKRLASGGSQSRGELGLLLATRLLQDAFRPHATPSRLPVWAGTCIHLVLPVDPYEQLFDRLRRAMLPATATAQRPDLVVVAIDLPAQGPVSIKLTPVEIKYRASGMAATDMREALTQAHSLGSLFEALWVQPPATDLWRTCAQALLSQFLDFGFRIYAANWLHGHQHGEWAAVHQLVLQDIVEGVANLTVNTAGRLIVFDGSPSTRVADLDGDHRTDSMIVSQDDARALLTGVTPVSPLADTSVSQLDFSFPGCANARRATGGSLTHPQSVAIAHTGTPLAHAGAQTPSAPVAPPISTPIATDVLSPPEAPADSIELPPEPGVEARSTNAGSPTATASRVPPAVRQRVRDAFEGFIGNDPAVSRLSNDLLRALIEQPPHLAKNFLFTGLPSTGKTELARRMARALALPFIKLDGRGVSSRNKLFELVNGELASNNLAASQIGQQVGLPVLEYPPLIVFIDEVHLVPRAVQEALLTMLEAADRTVVLSDHVARVDRATFLFATTRVSDVDAAFASRCDEIQLREYTEAEVAQILRWKVRHDDWHEAIYSGVARLGRCVPRIAIQLAEALETAVMVSEEQKTMQVHLDDVRHAREIDARGLTRMDFEYLSILERSTGPVGEQNILNLMRTVDKDRILNEVEPFLVRLGFIKHSPRGRELTHEGREYLLDSRARGQNPA